MFFISVTKKEIIQNFQKYNGKEIKRKSLYITVISDNFLSKMYDDETKLILYEIFPNNKQSNVLNNHHTSYVEYDKKKQILYIFRSAISGKPIYYCTNSKGEFFCSTHFKMLKRANVKLIENRTVLPEFFVYRIVFPPLTLFKNIKQLSIGDKLYLKIENENALIKKIEHFPFPTELNKIKSIDKCANNIIELIKKSIEKTEIRETQIATILSGGLDSSILTKINQQILNIDKSYSTGYPFEKEELNIEKKYALSAAEAFGLSHTYYESNNKEYLKGIIESIYAAEIPLNHLQSTCLFLLYKNGIPKNKNIIIEGWGAGGSFGNFRNYLYLKNKPFFKFISKPIFHNALNKTAKKIGKCEKKINMLIKSSMNLEYKNPNHPLWYFHDYGSREWTCDLFNVSQADIIINQYNSMKRYLDRSINDITALYSLLGDEDVTLSIISKLGEENKKAHIFPFYDLDLLQYVFLIPWKLKLKKPENILRKTIAKQLNLPNFISKRPKSGFGIRSDLWSVRDGIFDPLVDLSKVIIDERKIRFLQSSNPKKAMTFWNVVNYAIWKRLYIKDEPIDLLIEELGL